MQLQHNSKRQVCSPPGASLAVTLLHQGSNCRHAPPTYEDHALLRLALAVEPALHLFHKLFGRDIDQVVGHAVPFSVVRTWLGLSAGDLAVRKGAWAAAVR